ncbi:MAG: type B 50S ribosomal protein L31, partial [Planctomycetes bacterium]|nr:type B 50S ribosomal protein L31 [Planctomycetota bacterium]
MKKAIHPEEYRHVVFQDSNADFAFLTRSTVHTTETIQWEDGNEYPLYKLDISSASHPFYTGKQTYIDAAGRVEKFQKRFGWKEGKAAEVITQADEERTEKHRNQLKEEEAARKEASDRKDAREQRRKKILEGKKKKFEQEAEAKAKAAKEAAAKEAATKEETVSNEKGTKMDLVTEKKETNEAPTEEAPEVQAAVEETPAEGTPAEGTPAEETPAEQAP